MSEPKLVTREEWLSGRRAEWESSGTSLTFEAWQNQKRVESREEAEKRALAEMARERHERAVRRLEGQTPARYADARTESRELLLWAEILVQMDRDSDCGEITGPSRLIAGPTGTGKTHAMIGALHAYVHGGGQRMVTYVTAADLYARLRPQPNVNSEEVFASFANCALLALDDLGAAKGSEWTDEINYRLLNHRYNGRLPTLITSNVIPAQLAHAVGERVASRLAEMCEVVVLKGEDRRRNRGAA